MLLMHRRPDPAPPWSADEKERYLGLVQDLFNKKWLAEQKPHPLRALWKRRDLLATTELLSLGYLLDRIGTRTSPRYLADVKRRMRSTVLGDREGAALELIGAGSFDSADHPTELPRVNEPGYDFALRFDDRRVRVSCKVLVPSAEERAFVAADPRILKCVHAAVPAGIGVRVMLELVVPGIRIDPTLPRLSAVLRRELATWRPGAAGTFANPDWRISLEPLKPPDGLSWSKPAKSFVMVAASPLARDEQERFSSKVNDAVVNLREHCADVSDTQTNIILLKIPESISIANAVEMLGDIWPSGTEHVSGIFMYRSRILPGTEQLSHEFVAVGNPRARVTLTQVSQRQIIGRFPIGAVADHEVPRVIQLDPDTRLALNGYAYVGGELFFHAQRPASAQEFKFSLPRIPNVDTTYTVSGVAVDGDLSLGPNYAPREDLLLI